MSFLGRLFESGKKALHGAGSGLNFLGSKVKGGIDWLKGTAQKVDRTLKAIPIVADVYQQARRTNIPHLGKSVDELIGMGSRALDIAEEGASALQSKSIGEGISRTRALGRFLPADKQRMLDRGLGYVEGARTLASRF